MFRGVIFLSFMIYSLFARENPFFPVKDSQDLSITSNQIEKHQQLSQASISLPSSARVVREITVEYINLDGTVDKKIIPLDNSIDWHLPLVVSQADSTASTTVQKNAMQKKEEPLSANIKSIDFKFISFSIQNKKLKIFTKDKSIRNFILVAPYRIVADFKNDYDFRQYEKSLSGSIFKTLRIGNHDGYYRVVAELDGQYKYKFTKESDGYLIDCY